MTITIYHNPRCGTSRNTLAMIQDKGLTPTIIEYLKTPLTRPELVKIITDSGLSVREIMRAKESIYQELQLDNEALTDDQLIDAMIAHPILMNRPIVVTESQTLLCRPAEKVLTLIEN